ncbi:hypothetical protein SAMN04488690_1051 [Stenotrophomonas indicatrix]|uniref:Uncharacterized protein n=1 Tax=Stenotrophomonas indicatrix TaxID=2045451 RepID=A0A1W1GVI5_9GAMM|nr:hypothetical protein SAMN04488690_1051 [Stenotrophomonas indicatrix]
MTLPPPAPQGRAPLGLGNGMLRMSELLNLGNGICRKVQLSSRLSKRLDYVSNFRPPAPFNCGNSGIGGALRGSLKKCIAFRVHVDDVRRDAHLQSHIILRQVSPCFVVERDQLQKVFEALYRASDVASRQVVTVLGQQFGNHFLRSTQDLCPLLHRLHPSYVHIAISIGLSFDLPFTKQVSFTGVLPSPISDNPSACRCHPVGPTSRLGPNQNPSRYRPGGKCSSCKQQCLLRHPCLGFHYFPYNVLSVRGILA